MHHCGAASGQLPARLLRDAGLKVLPSDIRPREGRAWLVGWQGTRGVLRMSPMPSDSAVLMTSDVRWLHGYLARLPASGFPSPRPLPCFNGMSWTAQGGFLWEIVSYLPGRIVGWAGSPTMEKVGALLGRYHAAAELITMPGQQPGALPLAEVPAILLSNWLDVVPAERATVIRQLAAQLARDLDEASQQPADRLVIPGRWRGSHQVSSQRGSLHWTCAIVQR